MWTAPHSASRRRKPNKGKLAAALGAFLSWTSRRYEETREGDVYKRLLEKIELEREALGGGVFDILGQIFREQRLRDLLIEAIRYGDRPEVRGRLYQIVDNLTDRERCQELLEERALAKDSMDASQVQKIREDMERAEARRLQPHFIES